MHAKYLTFKKAILMLQGEYNNLCLAVKIVRLTTQSDKSLQLGEMCKIKLTQCNISRNNEGRKKESF